MPRGESSAAEQLSEEDLQFESEKPQKPELEVIDGKKSDKVSTEEKRRELRSRIMTNETRNMLLFHIKKYGFDEDEANTIVNDTMIKGDQAFNAANLKRPESLNAWLKRIATNKSIDLLRSKKRRKEISGPIGRDEEDNIDILDRIASDDATPEEMLEDLESDIITVKNKEFLKKIISQLGKEKRETLELQLQGKSLKEISEKLNISEGAVKSRLFRAKKDLKNIMKEKGIKQKEDIEEAA